MDNAFIRDVSTYRRDLNITEGAVNDAAKYIQLQTGQPLETCLAFAREKLHPNTETGFKDPKALVLAKNEVGDRYPKNMSLMRFISTVEKNNLLMSPSMAVYKGDPKNPSRHALYIEEGVANRKKSKNEMMQAIRDKNSELATMKNGEQQNFKLNNNAYSGATVSTSTILYYRSTHSSLTSTCRTATTYANAANEKFLQGNRHYYSPEITKANLVNLINAADLTNVQAVCEQYNLHYPTVTETVTMVKRSTDPYWGGEHHHILIENMIRNMTPVERAVVCYTADLYHLHLFNRTLVEDFLYGISEVGDETAHATPDDVYDSYDSDMKILANFVCFKVLDARDIAKVKTDDPLSWEKVKATAAHTHSVLNQFKAIIDAFWLTDVVPSSVYSFPSAYRRATPVSDTDSTMVTMQYWIEQMFGYVSFSPRAKQVVFGLTFLVSELMMHILAIQSANMGVRLDKMRLLAMKNEYYFPVLALMLRSKHYFAERAAQEGVMFEVPKLEVKGVGLRDSKVPKRINDKAKALMTNIINVIQGEATLNMTETLRGIGDIEREIVSSIRQGDYDFLTTGQVKSASSYKQAEEAPAYKQYLLWAEVFEPAFGKVASPPYTVVKASLKAKNRTELTQWCDAMKDQALADRLRLYLKANAKTNMTTLMIPAAIVENSGIPDDIIAGIDIRKMVFNCMGTFYTVLEALGCFFVDKRITRLVSDYH